MRNNKTYHANKLARYLIKINDSENKNDKQKLYIKNKRIIIFRYRRLIERYHKTYVLIPVSISPPYEERESQIISCSGDYGAYMVVCQHEGKGYYFAYTSTTKYNIAPYPAIKLIKIRLDDLAALALYDMHIDANFGGILLNPNTARFVMDKELLTSFVIRNKHYNEIKQPGYEPEVLIDTEGVPYAKMI